MATEMRKSRLKFQQCPGCNYDFVTGEGTKSCSWYECPYLPEDLKVFCPNCNYNFATDEGWSDCGYPPSCEWSRAGRANARKAREFFTV